MHAFLSEASTLKPPILKHLILSRFHRRSFASPRHESQTVWHEAVFFPYLQVFLVSNIGLHITVHHGITDWYLQELKSLLKAVNTYESREEAKFNKHTY